MTIKEEKWQKFLRRIWPFKFIPFVDFVLAAGSLATGNARPPHNLRQKEIANGAAQVMWGMNENSDFDVIVGVRQGRIFTARFFCFLVFKSLGWWAKHPPYKSNRSYKSYRNKTCFNHFVAPAAYRLSPPHNEYWKNLYQKLVPVYGEPAIIQKFFDANADWAGPRTKRGVEPTEQNFNSPRYGVGVEWLLDGHFGDWAERQLKAIQIRRIERSLPSQSGYKPRIIYNDNELEFHPDTKRIEGLESN